MLAVAIVILYWNRYGSIVVVGRAMVRMMKPDLKVMRLMERSGTVCDDRGVVTGMDA